MEVAVLLERRNEAFLLSALGPCLVLGLLGHLSFIAFSINEFNERASTALSLLIVVSALFSQVGYVLWCTKKFIPSERHNINKSSQIRKKILLPYSKFSSFPLPSTLQSFPSSLLPPVTSAVPFSLLSSLLFTLTSSNLCPGGGITFLP